MRNALVDLLRLASAVVIILFHAQGPGSSYMPAAMGVFTALLVVHARRGPAGAARRASRLLRPFAIWAALYGLLRVLDAWASDLAIAHDLLRWLPPLGTMYHLWFLPFAFVVAELASRVPRAERAGPEPAAAVAAAASAGTFLIGWHPLDLPPGVEVLGNYLPAAVLGLVMAGLGGRGLMAAALASLAVGLLAGLAGAGLTGQLTLGVPLVALALAFPRPGEALSRFAGELATAIFLVHPLMLALVHRLGPWPQGSDWGAWATVATSVAAGAALCSTRPGRRLL